jgi:hypothetical protein
MAGRTVTYTFVADIDDFAKPLGIAKAKASEFVSSLEDGSKSIASSFGAKIFAGAIAGLTVVGSVAAATVGYLRSASAAAMQHGDRIDDLGLKAGRSSKFMQELDYATSRVGVSLSSATNSIAKFDANLGDGTGKKFNEGLRAINLSVGELRAMAPEQQFQTITQRIGALGSAADQANVTKKIFGNMALLPVIRGEFDQLAARASFLGLVLSGDLVAASAKLKDKVADLTDSWKGFHLQIGGLVNSNASVHAFVDGLTNGLVGIRQAVFANTQSLQDFVSGGIVIVTKGLIGLVSAAQLTLNVFNALRLVWLSAETSALKLARAQLYIEQVMSLANPAKYALIGVDIAVLDDKIAKVGDSMQKVLDKDREWANGLGVVKSILAGVEKDVAKVAGKTVLVEQAARKAGEGAGVAFDAAADKAATAFEKAAAKARKAWDKLSTDLRAMAWNDEEALQKMFSAKNRAALPSIERSTMEVYKYLPSDSNNSTMLNDWYKDQQRSNRAGMKGLDTRILKEAFPGFGKETNRLEQGLQNITNVLNLASGRIAKSLASISGSATGMAGGLGQLFGDKKIVGNKFGDVVGKIGAWGQVAATGISLVSGIFGLFKKKPKEVVEAPKQVDAATWRGHVDDQLSKGTAGVAAGVGGIKITSAADLVSQATIAGQQFWAVFKTQGLVAAATAAKDVLATLTSAIGEHGSEAAAAILGPIQQQVQLAENEAYAGAANGAKGFADVLASQVNARMPMTLSQLDAYGQQAKAAFDQAKQSAIDSGMSVEAANQAAYGAVGPLIQTIIDAAATYGVTLDSNTQSLVDNAKASGVAFSTSSTDRLIMSVDALTTALGGVPPKLAEITNGINGIPTNRVVNVDVNYRGTGTIPQREGVDPVNDQGFAFGSSGVRDFGAGEWRRLHGREAILPEREYVSLKDAAAGGGGMQSGPVSFSVGEVHIHANDSAGGAAAADGFFERLETLMHTNAKARQLFSRLAPARG